MLIFLRRFRLKIKVVKFLTIVFFSVITLLTVQHLQHYKISSVIVFADNHYILHVGGLLAQMELLTQCYIKLCSQWVSRFLHLLPCMLLCCIINYLFLVPDIFYPAANRNGDAHALTPILTRTSCASVSICFLVEKHAWQQAASSSHFPDPAG
jgi:hypothetical protein